MARPVEDGMSLPESRGRKLYGNAGAARPAPGAWETPRRAAAPPISERKSARQQPLCRERAETPAPEAIASPVPSSGGSTGHGAVAGSPKRAAPRISLQSGALAYRVTDGGKVRVLLVSKRRSKRWGIPKGKAEPHLTLAENAAKEAFEEAGVKGRVAPLAAGKFRTTKQSPMPSTKLAIEVWVYLLEVTELSVDWPEKGRRRTKWVSCRKAAEMLGEPLLAQLCRRLAASRPS